MRHIDIDGVDPGYPAEPTIKFLDRKRKPTRQQQQQMRRSTYVKSYHQGRWDWRLGVRPETMRDWRGLERRLAALDAAWKVANEAFWASAASFRREEGTSAIVSIDEPIDRILIIHDDGYSMGNAEVTIERLIKNPHSEGRFSFYPYDQGGRELGLLHHREGRLHRAYGIYKLYFERAVVDRLSGAAKNLTFAAAGGRRFYSPTVFLVENEDRCYVFTMNHSGHIVPVEGDVATTSERK